MKNKIIFPIIVLFGCFTALVSAQNTTSCIATFPTVKEKGYYQVHLPPDFSACMISAAQNLRVYDSTGKEIPYLYDEQELNESGNTFVSLPKTGERIAQRWYSQTVFENRDRVLLDRMQVKIRNADANRGFWLSGSDDLNDWYIINENYEYNSYFDPASSHAWITLHFPPSNYKYFKVEVKHSWREPIQIAEAGFYKTSVKENELMQSPSPSVKQSEDAQNKRSVADITFPADYYIDEMVIEIDGPEMYHRNARLELVYRRKDGSEGTKSVRNFEITSTKENAIRIPSEKGSKWRLIIENGDDYPLRVAGVRGYQRDKYIRVHLMPGMLYQLETGDASMRSPKYDLVHFRNEIPKDLPQLNAVPSTLIKTDSSQQASANTNAYSFRTPGSVEQAAGDGSKDYFLWIAVGVLAIFLTFVSFKVLQDKEKGE